MGGSFGDRDRLIYRPFRQLHPYFQANGCAFEATTLCLQLTLWVLPVLGFENIYAEQNGLYNLAFLQDPAFPVGSWSGQAWPITSWIPGQAGNIVLTFTPDQTCTTEAVTGMTIYGTFCSKCDYECQPATPFTVSFSIEGDENTYSVNGTPATITLLQAPSLLLPILASSSMMPTTACLSLCRAIKLQLFFTNAGTAWPIHPQLSGVCVNQKLWAAFNNNATLESDTLLFCVTHQFRRSCPGHCPGHSG